MRKNEKFGKISKIWKNTKISENTPKIRGKKWGPFFKVSQKFGGKIRKNTENSEKYSEKFWKIVMRKLVYIWKNTENSEEYSEN